MRTHVLVFGLIAGGILATTELSAQEAAKPGRMVSIEVVIAQFSAAGKQAAGDLEAPEQLLARLAELEEQGAFDSLARIRLATIERQPAIVQIGERVPVASGQATFGPGGRGGGAQRVYQLENVGTMVNVVPQVEDDGSVIAELQIEKSRLVPRSAEAGTETADGGVGLSRTVTLTSKSTVRIPADGTIAVGGWHSLAGETSEEALILVTAHVSAAPPPAGAAAPAQEIKIFALQKAQAQDAAYLVGEIFGRQDLNVGIDARTNSLVVKATPDRLAEIEALLLRMDQEGQ